MRRFSASSTAILVVLLVLGVQLSSKLGHWLGTSRSDVAPVSVPGAAPVEGPYFSDGDRIADRMIAAINHSQKSIDVAMYDLTHPEITSALESAYHRGVRIRIIADENQATESRTEIPYLRSLGIPIRLSQGFRGNHSLMHDKFAVFDGRLAETGSFNWTVSAERYNYENVIFLSDPTAVARFEKEFQRIWEQAR